MYGLSRECLFNGKNPPVDCALKHWRNQNLTCMKDGTYSHQRRLTLARHCDVTKALDSLRLNGALHHICICYFPTSPVQYLTLRSQRSITHSESCLFSPVFCQRLSTRTPFKRVCPFRHRYHTNVSVFFAVFALIFVPQQNETYYDLGGALGWISTTFLSLYYPYLKAKYWDGISGPLPALSTFAPRQLLLTAAVGIWSIRLGSYLAMVSCSTHYYDSF